MSALSPSEVQKLLDSQQDTRRTCQSMPATESHLDLLAKGTFADVTFIVGPTKTRIPCHQVFLKARSPVFEAMFSVCWNQHSNREVVLEDVHPYTFVMFLRYVYADTSVTSVSDALELLQLAHKYDVKLLLTRCEELLGKELTLDVAVDVFQAARQYDRIDLMHKVGDLMAKSLHKLQTLPVFSRMDKQTLVYILKRNDLKMREVHLFCLVLEWANNQTSRPEQSLVDILPLIRFPIMTPNEFTSAVVPTGLLPQSTLLELFTYFGSDGETKKSMAKTLKFSTERRQCGVSIASVALYSADFAKCKIKQEAYFRISECLKLTIDNIRNGSLFNRLSSLLSSQAEKKKNIALSGITLYFPTICPTNSSGAIAPISLKQFQIVLKVKRLKDTFYKVLQSLHNLKAEEGKLTEVEFGAEVCLEIGVRYCIVVAEENWTMQEGTDGDYYEVRDFGSIQRSVNTNVGESCVCVGNISNKIASSKPSSIYTSPQLIYKLHLKEW